MASGRLRVARADDAHHHHRWRQPCGATDRALALCGHAARWPICSRCRPIGKIPPREAVRRAARPPALHAAAQRQGGAPGRLFPQRARPRSRLGPGGDDRCAELRPRQAGADPRAGFDPDRSGPVRLVLRLRRRSRRDGGLDVAGACGRTALADARRGGGGAGDHAQGRAAAAGRGLARHAGCHRPLGAPEAGDRWAAGGRLGAAGQARPGRVRPPGAGRDRGGLARPGAALRQPCSPGWTARARAPRRTRCRCSGP